MKTRLTLLAALCSIAMGSVRIGLAFMLLGTALPALSDEGKKEEQSLDQAANDPTASLMSVQIQDIYAGNYHKLDNENGNTLLLRSAVPFEVGGLNNIARATMPIVTKSPSGASGLSDLVLFDLIVFNQSWGRWGVGPVMLFPTATDDKAGRGKVGYGARRRLRRAERKIDVGCFQPEPVYLCG